MPENGNSTPWLRAMLVALFGAVGGFTAWVYSVTVGEPMDLGQAAAVASNVFFGLVAGFIGIFVLIRDPSRALLHTLALALLCGFAWKPTLEAGRELAITRVQEWEVKAEVKVARQQIEAVEEADKKSAPTVIGQLQAASTKLLDAGAELRSPALRSELEQVVARSVRVLDEVAEMAPEDSARALGAIGVAASASDRPAISGAAARSLVSLAEREGFGVGTTAEVVRSLNRLSAAAMAARREGEAGELREQGAEVYRRAEEIAERQGPAVLEELQSRSEIRRERPPPR